MHPPPSCTYQREPEFIKTACRRTRSIGIHLSAPPICPFPPRLPDPLVTPLCSLLPCLKPGVLTSTCVFHRLPAPLIPRVDSPPSLF